MADTNYPVGHALAVAHWSKKLMVEALSETSFLKFTGTTASNIVQIKSETKSEGDNITFGLRMQLNGNGVVGDGTLEGNEEALVTYSDKIYINQLRHAVRSGGKMSEQRVPFTVRDEAKDGLVDWWAGRFDSWFFNQLCGAKHADSSGTDYAYLGLQATNDPISASDTDHYYLPDGRTTEATVGSASASGIMSLKLIDAIVAKSKTISPIIRPLMIRGEKKFVMFLHPNQVYDLRTNTNTGQWLDIQKAAMQGGNVSNNPIYTGALGEYNGVILHESTRIPTAAVTPTGGGLRRAVFCGAQAACMAFGGEYGLNRMSWVEEMFDYENKLGVSAGIIGGLKKTRFNSKDYATILCTTYTTLA